MLLNINKQMKYNINKYLFIYICTLCIKVARHTCIYIYVHPIFVPRIELIKIWFVNNNGISVFC